jgi:hypothetical protein
MNTKVAIGLVAAIIILGAAFLFTHHAPAPAVFTPTASTTPMATTTTSGVAPLHVAPTTPTTPAAPVVSKKPARNASYDTSSLSSTSAHPVITGTANVSAVAMVVDDPSGVGIVGSSDIPVVNGHWSFAIPVSLKSGTYRLHLIGGDVEDMASLVVKLP